MNEPETTLNVEPGTSNSASSGGIEVAAIERKFNYNGMELPDPNPHAPITEVQAILARTHPEIATAKIEGPDIDGPVHSFNIVRAVGTKG